MFVLSLQREDVQLKGGVLPYSKIIIKHHVRGLFKNSVDILIQIKITNIIKYNSHICSLKKFNILQNMMDMFCYNGAISTP